MKARFPSLGPVSVFRGFLGLVAAVLVWALIVGPKPWEQGVAVAEAAGNKTDYIEFVASYFWPMAVANLVLCALLFAVAPWLIRPIAEKQSEASQVVVGRGQRILLAVCLAASVGTALFHMVPRLNKSFWVDEERTSRRLIFGNYARVNEKGKSTVFGEFAAVKPVPWSATVWRYRTPNNHPFYSLSARASHELISKISPPHPLHFREWAIRLPAVIAGVGALFSVSWLLLSFGFVRAAMIAPLLLSVHAYFLRFSSDARGYSMTFLLLPLCALFLWRGIETGRWRWWAGFALAQFLVAWSHGSSLYFLAVLNAWGFAVPWLWKGGLPMAERLAANGRQFAMSCLSGMAFLQMFLPNLAQAAQRFSEEDGVIHEDNGLGKLQDMLSYYFTGTSWRGLRDDHPNSHRLLDGFGNLPWLVWVYIALLAALFFYGVWLVWKRGGAMRWAALLLVAPGPLMFVISYLRNFFMFEQYIIFTVPWIAMALAIGLGGISMRFRKKPLLGTLPALLFVSVYAWACGPQRVAYRTKSLEQNKEAVLMVRGSLDPEAPGYHDVLTGGFVRYTRTYDPHIYPIKSIADVERLMAMSRESGKPLWLYQGQLGFAEQIGPDVVAFYKKNFEHVTHLYGLDGMSHIDLFKFDPAARQEKSETPN